MGLLLGLHLINCEIPSFLVLYEGFVVLVGFPVVQAGLKLSG